MLTSALPMSKKAATKSCKQQRSSSEPEPPRQRKHVGGSRIQSTSRSRGERTSYDISFWHSEDSRCDVVCDWPTHTTVQTPCPFLDYRRQYGDQVVEVVKRSPSKGILGYFFQFPLLYGYIEEVGTALEMSMILISHAYKFKHSLVWLNRPQLVTTRHFGRYGEYYKEESVRIAFEFSRTRHVLRNLHVVTPSLNGNNGEWTNTDDLAAVDPSKGGGAAKNAKLNQKRIHESSAAHKPQNIPPVVQYPVGSTCHLCKNLLAPAAPSGKNALMPRKAGVRWSCGCITCAECFASKLNSKIIELCKEVDTVECIIHKSVSACSRRCLINRSKGTYILPSDEVPYWEHPTFLAGGIPEPPPPPPPTAPMLPRIVDRHLYVFSPPAPKYTWWYLIGFVLLTLLIWSLYMFLLVWNNAGLYEYLFSVLAACLFYTIVFLYRRQFVKYTVRSNIQTPLGYESDDEMTDLLGYQTMAPTASHVRRTHLRDSFMGGLGYNFQTREPVYESWAQKMLSQFGHKAIQGSTGRIVQGKLRELADQHIAAGGLPPDNNVLLNTAIYATQACELAQAKISRYNSVKKTELGEPARF